MSDMIKRLHREHASIGKLLAVVDSHLEALPDEEISDVAVLLDAMQYMSTYPDLLHHPTEDLIYEKLLAHDPGARPLVETLMEEHKSLTELGSHFAATLRNLLNGFHLKTEAVQNEARRYLDLQREHMNKEETEAFVLAKKHLSKKDWEDVETSAKSREDPLFGQTVQKQYRALYDRVLTLAE